MEGALHLRCTVWWCMGVQASPGADIIRRNWRNHANHGQGRMRSDGARSISQAESRGFESHHPLQPFSVCGRGFPVFGRTRSSPFRGRDREMRHKCHLFRAASELGYTLHDVRVASRGEIKMSGPPKTGPISSLANILTTFGD